jgi:Ca2+-binding RTX toxin-like protein
MSNNLESIIRGIEADSGLKAGQSAANINKGIVAARALNDLLLKAIDSSKADADGHLTAGDMKNIARETYAHPADYVKFLEAHGNDTGPRETGFHHLQGDGGTLQFQGRNFINTVADAIYHFGFEITNGRYVNEDGNANELAVDVAGWLNYFLHGVNMVYGSSGKDELGSGEYSKVFSRAANETFDAGKGDDKVWAGKGSDTVFAGEGNDTVGGGVGNDKLHGDAGRDTLWGEAGNDMIFGDAGADTLGGGLGNDTFDGGAGADKVYGEAGADTIVGGAGSDDLSGGAGRDRIKGDDGRDKLNGGESSDTLDGGKGADTLILWETAKVRDTLVFHDGDSGKNHATMDRVEGFVSGQDVIDLRSFGPMSFETLNFEGGGKASIYYDGHYLRIDGDGNGSTDMMVEFAWVNKLAAGDFLLA